MGSAMPEMGTTLRPRTSHLRLAIPHDVTTPAREADRLLDDWEGWAYTGQFKASVAKHLADSPCDFDNAATSLRRLTKCVTDAARETHSVGRSQPLRKPTQQAAVRGAATSLLQDGRPTQGRWRDDHHYVNATAEWVGEVPWHQVPTPRSWCPPEPREPACRGRRSGWRRAESLPQGSTHTGWGNVCQ